MKTATKQKNQNNQSSARIVDGKLILSLPNAQNPVVWQMTFEDVKASALEVQDDKKGTLLVMKTPKGEKNEVATFDNRDDAVHALMATSSAFENAHGRIRTQAASQPLNSAYTEPRKKKKSVWPLLLSILGVVLLFMVWSSLNAPRTNTGGAFQATSSQTGQDARQTTGVPVSADAFLQGN